MEPTDISGRRGLQGEERQGDGGKDGQRGQLSPSRCRQGWTRTTARKGH